MFNNTSTINSFFTRLTDYRIKNVTGKKSYSLTILIPGFGERSYRFDNLDFLTGFVTLFEWIGEDHHKHWTEFKQCNDPGYPQGKTLNF